MDEYFITKGGYYYRPNAQGYTSSKIEAGRFTLEEAIKYSHPNGPDGPRDGIRYERATQEAPSSDVERLVDAAVTAWHDSDKNLEDWLGWTREEYAEWVRDPKKVPRVPKHYAALASTAGDTLKAENERITELEAALGPFANWAVAKLTDTSKWQPDSAPVFAHNSAQITLGDLRRARTALGSDQ